MIIDPDAREWLAVIEEQKKELEKLTPLLNHSIGFMLLGLGSPITERLYFCSICSNIGITFFPSHIGHLSHLLV